MYKSVLKYLVLAAKLLAFAFMVMVLVSMISIPLTVYMNGRGVDAYWVDLANETVLFVAVLLSAALIIRFWDRQARVLSSLGLTVRGRGRDFLRGTLTAAALYAVGFGVSVVAGWVAVTGVNLDWSMLLMQLVLMLAVAVAEETMVRGFVLGHLLDLGMNRYLALVLSSLLFSLLHFGNPDFGIMAFVNIFLAGMLLGSAYIYTRNLSYSVALHLFWNWIQGPVLGYDVSGLPTGGVLSLSLSPDVLLNGGSFGFEASLPCTVLMLLMTALTLRIYRKEYQLTCKP